MARQPTMLYSVRGRQADTRRKETPMALTLLPREVTLRSTDANWTRELWEQLPDDGNRYEIIDGVLYVSTAPSVFHQWVVQELFAELRQQLVVTGIGLAFVAPIGLFMLGAEPVQP